MKLTKREILGVPVVEIHGKLLGGPGNSEKFRGLFKSLINEGKNKIIINLKHTPFANSIGIGMLIGVYTSAKNSGGALVLTHVHDRVQGILIVTRLYLIFKTFDTDDEAVRYLLTDTDERNAIAI